MDELDQSLKFIKTKDVNGVENGWVIEVCKLGDKTVAYQTLVYGTPDPETPIVKGYHCYHKQTNYMTCVAGFVTLRVFWDKKRKVDYKLAEHRPVCLRIPPENPFAIINYGREFARVINHPDPLWHPDTFKDDQFLWTPTAQQLSQNGQIINLEDFQ